MAALLRRSGRQQRQRQQAERAVGRDDQISGRTSSRARPVEQQRVELVAERDVEGRNIGDHRGLRVERGAQASGPCSRVAAPRRHGCEGNRAVLRHRPDEARVAPEVERQERLPRREHRPDLLDGRRLGIDQIRVGRKAPGDLLPGLAAFGAKRLDRRAGRLDDLLVPLARRQRQRIVESAELCGDLLGEVLLLAHELGERRVVRHHAGARRRQRLLHRLPADRVREAEGLGRNLGPALGRGFRHQPI